MAINTNQRPKAILYWVRRDFRLTDNPALSKALESAREQNLPLIPIYILDDGLLADNNWNIGFSRRHFLSKALAYFASNFDFLYIFVGKTEKIFEKIAVQIQLEVFANDDIEPYSRTRDAKIAQIVTGKGGAFHAFRDQMTISEELKSGTGNSYSVYSPLRNSAFESFLQAPIYPKVDQQELKKYTNLHKYAEIKAILEQQKFLEPKADIETVQKQIFELIDRPNILYFQNPEVTPISINIDELVARPNLDKYWYYTEEEAQKHFDIFVNTKLLNYKECRDNLGLDVDQGSRTSQMSPALKWGLVSARYLTQEILEVHSREQIFKNQNIYHYVSELLWREFYRYVLYHKPEVLNVEFQQKYRGDKIQWLYGDEATNRFKAWITGNTGYAVVDAAMNQISQMGWMHNRSRMIVGSILTKNLGLNWRWGQEYFRLMLIDLDEASNNGGWQWAASVGADPKPIRIFNPYTQAKNYDADNAYQKKWLPKSYNYQKPPLVDHKLAREQALERYGLNSQKNSEKGLLI